MTVTVCFTGILGVASFSFVGVSALTHDEGATLGFYCGTSVSQPQ